MNNIPVVTTGVSLDVVVVVIVSDTTLVGRSTDVSSTTCGTLYESGFSFDSVVASGVTCDSFTPAGLKVVVRLPEMVSEILFGAELVDSESILDGLVTEPVSKTNSV